MGLDEYVFLPLCFSIETQKFPLRKDEGLFPTILVLLVLFYPRSFIIDYRAIYTDADTDTDHQCIRIGV